MKLLNCVTVIILLSFTLSCSVFTKNETAQEEVFLDDGYRETADEEVVIDDTSFSVENEKNEIVKNAQNSPIITTKAADGSTFAEMTDGAGNKSESRCFDNHPRIGCIVLKTSVGGDRKILVFGQNGEVKTLSADKIENILTISADEAASAAEIYEGRKYNSSPMLTQKPQDSQMLQPMPSYKFPVRPPPPAQEAETIEEMQSTEKSAGSETRTKDDKAEEQDGQIMQNLQSEKQNEN